MAPTNEDVAAQLAAISMATADMTCMLVSTLVSEHALDGGVARNVMSTLAEHHRRLARLNEAMPVTVSPAMLRRIADRIDRHLKVLELTLAKEGKKP